MSDAIAWVVLVSCACVLGTVRFLIWREDRRWDRWWNGEGK